MSTLAGTGPLLRLMLRRDRLRAPLWVGGLALLTGYFSVALGVVLDDSGLIAMAQLARSPVTALVGGPGYGFEDITVPRFLAGLYGVYLMLGAALMSMTTVTRHTRAEEQHGRAELVLADVVGRHAPLTAALLVAVLMNVAVAVLMAGVVLVSPLSPARGPTVLFACSVAAVGIAFAGVAASTAQLSPYARTCTSLAGLGLAVSFIVRGLGDMSRVQGGSLSWLSWLSPLGWAQQAAPYTLDHWWPLAFPLLLGAAGAGVGYGLRSRRDLGGGALADRPGSARAPAWLRSPLALAFRLHRAPLVGWSVALLIAGVVFGAFTQTMVDSAANMPPEILAAMGGSGALTEGYLGFMSLYFGAIIAVYALLSVQTLRAQESSGHTEAVLATAVGRPRWMLSWVGVTAGGVLWLSALAGLAEGGGAVLVTGDGSLLLPTLLGHTVQAAPVWLLLSLAAALYGAAPRALGLAWVPFLLSCLLAFFGRMLQLEQRWLDLSVFEHVGQHPATAVNWSGVGVLTVGAVVIAGLGAIAFRRRDLLA